MLASLFQRGQSDPGARRNMLADLLQRIMPQQGQPPPAQPPGGPGQLPFGLGQMSSRQGQPPSLPPQAQALLHRIFPNAAPAPTGGPLPAPADGAPATPAQPPQGFQRGPWMPYGSGNGVRGG
jgi:hypothetical protein